MPYACFCRGRNQHAASEGGAGWRAARRPRLGSRRRGLGGAAWGLRDVRAASGNDVDLARGRTCRRRDAFGLTQDIGEHPRGARDRDQSEGDQAEQSARAPPAVGCPAARSVRPRPIGSEPGSRPATHRRRYLQGRDESSFRCAGDRHDPLDGRLPNVPDLRRGRGSEGSDVRVGQAVAICEVQQRPLTGRELAQRPGKAHRELCVFQHAACVIGAQPRHLTAPRYLPSPIGVRRD
ncbi:MAG: hypothetical protein QOI98_1896 [Solirubrobacteraceae bacterium]|nr:hypothetical protein [Solirubrobacteraceae bacterium]